MARAEAAAFRGAYSWRGGDVGAGWLRGRGLHARASGGSAQVIPGWPLAAARMRGSCSLDRAASDMRAVTWGNVDWVHTQRIESSTGGLSMLECRDVTLRLRMQQLRLPHPSACSATESLPSCCDGWSLCCPCWSVIRGWQPSQRVTAYAGGTSAGSTTRRPVCHGPLTWQACR